MSDTSSILTPTQREYLRGERNLTKANERATKSRIRRRVARVPGDLVLVGNLSNDDLEKIVSNMDPNEVEKATQFLKSVQRYQESAEQLGASLEETADE